ncbi:alpha/beta fold hydrolase [Streptomyces sp. SID4919]|uniref:alpha/beta fold hydrolase n=1 Tax=unclassified Streptomyces TaxID=2593676 RepID=UPI000C080BB5|nr:MULTISPECIES: alpha/beta hydrolase [unclassified Streptomyces]MYY11283.1 alpha/beta fold hydrolase [Streptomyces sp. SID4919]
MSRPSTFVPPPGVRTRVISTPRGRFAALDALASTAPVRGTALLLPGFTGSKEDFLDLQPPLAARGYRTVAVDGRGQYESDGPRDDESAYARAELVRDVLAQRDALADAGVLTAPVHLLGHSLGGQIARAAVLDSPEAFASLTLMASGPAEVSAHQRERVKMLRDALAVLDLTQVWEAMRSMEAPEDAVTGARADGPEDESAKALRNRWLRTSPAQLVATGRQLCTEPDRVAELAALDLPLHVISGERDDTWPIPLLDDMAIRLAARRTVVRGAEHSPNTDRPHETATALADFWDTVPT